jgi:hypothetical protein
MLASAYSHTRNCTTSGLVPHLYFMCTSAWPLTAPDAAPPSCRCCPCVAVSPDTLTVTSGLLDAATRLAPEAAAAAAALLVLLPSGTAARMTSRSGQ